MRLAERSLLEQSEPHWVKQGEQSTLIVIITQLKLSLIHTVTYSTIPISSTCLCFSSSSCQSN